MRGVKSGVFLHVVTGEQGDGSPHESRRNARDKDKWHTDKNGENPRLQYKHKNAGGNRKKNRHNGCLSLAKPNGRDAMPLGLGPN